MTNHDMLAFVYENGPCTHIDIDFQFGCGVGRVSVIAHRLMMAGLLDYDSELGLFVYREDAWL